MLIGLFIFFFERYINHPSDVFPFNLKTYASVNSDRLNEPNVLKIILTRCLSGLTVFEQQLDLKQNSSEDAIKWASQALNAINLNSITYVDPTTNSQEYFQKFEELKAESQDQFESFSKNYDLLMETDPQYVRDDIAFCRTFLKYE